MKKEDYGFWTPLFADILRSSIWMEDDKTLRMWIGLLAAKNKNGFVSGSPKAIAHMVRLSVKDAREALTILESPDPDSKNDEFEGRRIKKVESGWLILNHARYRDAIARAEKNDYSRKLMKKRYDEKKAAEASGETPAPAEKPQVKISGKILELWEKMNAVKGLDPPSDILWAGICKEHASQYDLEAMVKYVCESHASNPEGTHANAYNWITNMIRKDKFRKEVASAGDVVSAEDVEKQAKIAKVRDLLLDGLISDDECRAKMAEINKS